MRSLVRRRAALGAAVVALVAVAVFAVPTCGDAPEPVRPIVLDRGAQEASPGEGSDGGMTRMVRATRTTTSTRGLRAAIRATCMIETRTGTAVNP